VKLLSVQVLDDADASQVWPVVFVESVTGGIWSDVGFETVMLAVELAD